MYTNRSSRVKNQGTDLDKQLHVEHEGSKKEKDKDKRRPHSTRCEEENGTKQHIPLVCVDGLSGHWSRREEPVYPDLKSSTATCPAIPMQTKSEKVE